MKIRIIDIIIIAVRVPCRWPYLEMRMGGVTTLLSPAPDTQGCGGAKKERVENGLAEDL